MVAVFLRAWFQPSAIKQLHSLKSHIDKEFIFKKFFLK